MDDFEAYNDIDPPDPGSHRIFESWIDGNGVAGTLYVDDIVLYQMAPEIVVPSEEIWIGAEAATTITAPMQTYDNPLASVGKYISMDENVGDNNSNTPAVGIATYNFTVTGGIYKIRIRV